MHWVVVIYLFQPGQVGYFNITLPGFWSETECHAILNRMRDDRSRQGVAGDKNLKSSLKTALTFTTARCEPGEFGSTD